MNHGNTPPSRVYVLTNQAQPKIYAYLDAVVEKKDQIFIGNIITPLDLNDWAELHGYMVKRFEEKAVAGAGERTNLAPKSRMPGVFKSKQTILGIPAPASAAALAPTPIAGTVIKVL